MTLVSLDLNWEAYVMLTFLDFVGEILHKTCERGILFSVFRKIEKFFLLLNATMFDLFIKMSMNSFNSSWQFFPMLARPFFTVDFQRLSVKVLNAPFNQELFNLRPFRKIL